MNLKLSNLKIKLLTNLFKIYSYNYLLFLSIYNNSYLFYIFFLSYFYDTYLIKNNKIIKRINFHNLKEYNNYDYFVNWHISNDNIIYNINSYLLREKVQKSDYQFLLIYLYVNNKKYDLTQLIQEKHNCYLSVNNKLFDINFFNWINFYFFNDKLLRNNYYFTIMDRNINTYILNNEQYIILQKNNYKIKN